MKRFFIVTNLLICFLYVKAQVPAGGEDLISDPLSNYVVWGPENGNAQVVSVVHPDFTEAIEVETSTQPENTYNFQLNFNPVNTDIKTGDIVLYTFYARTTASIQETGEGFTIAVIEQNSDPYEKVTIASLSIGTAWQQYYIAGEAGLDLATNEISVNLQLGFPIQTLQFADIRAINYRNQYTLADMPVTDIQYIGQNSNASWRAEADNRIESIRKGDIEINIVDENGQPIGATDISINMKQHKFGFGTAIDAPTYMTDQRYRDTINSLFNEVVFENDLKWPQWMDLTRRAQMFDAITALEQLKIDVRGHVQVWPSFRWSPDFIKNNETYFRNNPDSLKRAVDAHIDDITNALKGKLNDWDVLNEPYANTDYMDILGDEEMAEWFKRVDNIDPDIDKYINDYSILSGGGLDKTHQDHYFNTITQIQSEGGDIEGIGMQSHFSSQLTPIDTLKVILDRYASFGLPIKSTEFDININQPNVQAEYTRDFYTLLFSHPSVESILMWGFWEGRHWRPDAAMFTTDWTEKPNYTAYKDLIFNDWWTNEELTSNNLGIATTRGFLGTYEYEVIKNGEIYTGTFDVLDNSNTNDIIITLEDASSGNIPEERRVNWEIAGYESSIPCSSLYTDVTEAPYNIDNTGTQDVTSDVQDALNNVSNGTVLFFPAGNYKFSDRIDVPSDRIIRGVYPTETIFEFDLAGANKDVFRILGSANSWKTVTAIDGFKGNTVTLSDVSGLNVGDDIEIEQDNDPTIHYIDRADDNQTWAQYLKGQMAVITAINGNVVTLDRYLTYDYDLTFDTRLRSLNPKSEVGFENFKVIRKDDATGSANNNFLFQYANNCWIRRVHSEYTSRYHIRITRSRNIQVDETFLDKSYSCGGGGEGYGLLCDDHASECLFQNNIANALRHPWIVKEGATRNVYAYNYSFGTTQGDNCDADPLTEAYADISIHGHYPAYNLFEGNVVGRITDVDFWGPAGPGNTFLRNRSTQEDAIQVMTYSHDQNLEGNEVDYPSSTLSVDNTSTGTLLAGNNVNGVIGSADNPIAESYFYESEPSYWHISDTWPSIGGSNTISSGTIPAKERHDTFLVSNDSDDLFTIQSDCQILLPLGDNIDQYEILRDEQTWGIRYASQDQIIIYSQHGTAVYNLLITDVTGRVLIDRQVQNGDEITLPDSVGYQIITLKNEDGEQQVLKKL